MAVLQSKNKILKSIIIIWLNCIIVFSVKSQTIIPYSGPMPIPPSNEKMLFYLQRTIDINTLIYEIDYSENGVINKNKPIKIYWLDFSEGIKITPLSFSQKMFAYGVQCSKMDEKATIFKIHLVSFKKIVMYLKPSGKNGKYQMHINLNNTECILNNILVHITGGTYMNPDVSDIELIGKNIKTEKKIIEKIKP